MAVPPSGDAEEYADISISYRVPATLCARAGVSAAEGKAWLSPWQTGIPAFDSLTTRLGGARRYYLRCYGALGTYLRVYYREPVNFLAVRRQFPEIEGVQLDLLALIEIGGGDFLQIMVGRDRWTVRLSAGWGDCPSGCINRHEWHFDYTPTTRALRLIQETGPPVPTDRRGYDGMEVPPLLLRSDRTAGSRDLGIPHEDGGAV